MYLSYVEIVLYSTLLIILFFLLMTLSLFLTFSFSTTSASLERWMMVDLEGKVYC